MVRSAVALCAATTFVAWVVAGPQPALAHAIVNAVLRADHRLPLRARAGDPMSIMVGTGRGASMGVLVRNAEALELMEKVDTLVVDKTGTLTEGKPKLVAVEAAAGFTVEDVLGAAAALERASEHPLAHAIVAGARNAEWSRPRRPVSSR